VDLDRAERSLGVNLLPAVHALYAWHDGAGGIQGPFWLAPDFGFLPLSDVVKEWRINEEVAADTYGSDFNDDPFANWKSRWIPVATSWTGDLLVVSHEPDDSKGHVFVAQPENRPNRDDGWLDLADLIGEGLSALEGGQTWRGRQANIRDGMLTWD